MVHRFHFEGHTFDDFQDGFYGVHRGEARDAVFYRHTANLKAVAFGLLAFGRSIHHILHLSFLNKVYKIDIFFADFITDFCRYTFLSEIFCCAFCSPNSKADITNLLASSTASALSLSETVKRIAP